MLLFLFFNTILFSTEPQQTSFVECTGADCKQTHIFVNLPRKDLEFSDFPVGQCFLQNNTSNFFRVEKIQGRNITFFVEKEVNILHRERYYFDSKKADFLRKDLNKIDCRFAGKLGDVNHIHSCFKGNNFTQKTSCPVERWEK